MAARIAGGDGLKRAICFREDMKPDPQYNFYNFKLTVIFHVLFRFRTTGMLVYGTVLIILNLSVGALQNRSEILLAKTRLLTRTLPFPL